MNLLALIGTGTNAHWWRRAAKRCRGNMSIVAAVASAFYGSSALLVAAGGGPEDRVAVRKPITKKARLTVRLKNGMVHVHAAPLPDYSRRTASTRRDA